MSRFFCLLAILLPLSACSETSPGNREAERATQKPGYPIHPVSYADVELEDGFWTKRVETNRNVTLPHLLEKLEGKERVKNLQRAAVEEGSFCTTYPFDDTDVYKTIEAASYALQRQDDPALDRRIDSLIATVAAAQQEDGYIYSYGALKPNEDPERKQRWWGSGRWDKVHLISHELYNAGHLIEAAVAHYRATGKRNLLDVAIDFADLIAETLGPGPDQQQTIPGHPEIEKALVKLYRVTDERKYLELADFFLAERGKKKYNEEGEDGTYKQNHKPVKEQSEAVGHAVRAAYLYSAMTDVGMLTDDQGYLDAVDRLWGNIVGKKFYLIGGIGATGQGEGFGGNYELPNETAYNETCAAIANVMWNHRMFLARGNAKYIDVLERSLYNNVLSGVSMKGNRFFYPNPLASDGDYERSPWFTCACCPPNAARMIASMPKYLYAVRGDTAFVNLFANNTASLDLAGTPVEIQQQTDYPWEGTVRMRVRPQEPSRFTMKVRVPGWARGKPVPSDLYRYQGTAAGTPQLRVNGEAQPLDMQKGYAVVTRKWAPGDVVELELPMSVRRVAAHDSVEADRGKVALERGPLVYALESVDNGEKVRSLSVDAGANTQSPYRRALLGGVTVLEGAAYEGGQKQSFTAVPYYAWAHRGSSKMAVWMDRK
jgi:DUF1680 family protein